MNYLNQLLGFSIFMILGLSSTCRKEGENCHKGIDFNNKSNKAVYVQLGYTKPDTSVPFEFAQIKVEANSIDDFSLTALSSGVSHCFEEYMTKGNANFRNDTLSLFIYDSMIKESITWDSVRKKNLVLKRLDLSINDLQKLNWTVVFL